MTTVSHISYGDETLNRFTSKKDGPMWKLGSDLNHLNFLTLYNKYQTELPAIYSTTGNVSLIRGFDNLILTVF